jgi:hypothetical protein
MNPSLLSILQEQFLNKKITVPVLERDQRGRTIPNKYTTASGQCTFIGSNPVLGYDLQVTIDGMPIQIKHINDISLTPDPIRIRK